MSEKPLRSEAEQREIESAVAELKEFHWTHKLGDVTIRALIDEGRRY